MSSVRQTGIAYSALFLLLAGLSIPCHQVGWRGTGELHTLMETVSCLLAFVAAAIALTRYYTKKTPAYLLVGSALVGAALLDGYHAVVTSSFLSSYTPSALSALTPWSGVTSRVFLALLMCLGSFTRQTEAREAAAERVWERIVYSLVGAFTLATFLFFALAPLPPAYYPHLLFHRPAELVPALFFALAAVGHLRKGAWKQDSFERWLLMSLIVAAAGHLLYMPFSGQLFDLFYGLAHLLKILSYVLVLAGLFVSMSSIFHREAQSVAHLQRLNESLAHEVEERQRAEGALRKAGHGLEEQVEVRTAELAEQMRLAALQGAVGMALTQGGDLQKTLQRCAEIIGGHLGAAFARIWTLNEAENVLELQASAGMYTHLNGPKGRIPVGSKVEIALIAENRQPHLTNAVIGDPAVTNQEWARREGLVAFAGYPLVIEDRLVGVVAAFARKPLTEYALRSLGSVANAIALGVEHKSHEAALFHLATIVESSEVAIISTTLEGRVLTGNRAAERVFGYSRGEVRGMDVSLLMEPDRREEAGAILQRTAQGESIEHYETVCLRKDGQRIDVLLTVSPIRDAAGRVIATSSIAADITERKLLERQLAQAQKLESIGQLAAGIAHEINTPIQYVGDNIRFLRDSFKRMEQLFQGYDRLLASLKSELPSTPFLADVEALAKATRVSYLRAEIPKSIEDSLDGAGRVAEIVRAIKEFSHPGASEKTPLDINRAIESTVLVSRNEWKYVAELNTDLDPSLPPVHCVPGEFNQVILNLIVNAAHAIADVVSAKPETKGTITVSTHHDGDWAEIRVGDTGTGVPHEARSSLFNPFFTTKAVGKGTGQGLAIAHTVIVQKHGGTITFDTEMGVGTTFKIRLPIGGNITQTGEEQCRQPEPALPNE